MSLKVICRETGTLGTVEQTDVATVGGRPWYRVTWEDSFAGQSSWYGPRDVFVVPSEEALRFGTFGPPSDEPSAYLMSTLDVVEVGETYQNVRYAHAVKSPYREDRPFFRVLERGTRGLLIGGNGLGAIYYRAPGEKPIEEGVFESKEEGVFKCWTESEHAEDCRAIGRAALDRYLAFLFLHQETEPSDLDCLLTWRNWFNYGKFQGRVQMRDRAAEVAERCSGGDDELSKRDLIAQNIRALDVWQ